MNGRDKMQEVFNDISPSVLMQNSRPISKAMMGNDDTKKELVRLEHVDLDYLEDFLNFGILALGKRREEDEADEAGMKSKAKILDSDWVLGFINDLSTENKIVLVQSIIAWFCHELALDCYDPYARLLRGK